MTEVLTIEQSRIPDLLRRTAPWVRFMAVIMFIGAGFMVVAGLAMSFGGVVGGLAAGREDGGLPMVAVGVAYAAIGLFNLIPAVLLWRFATRSRAYVASPGTLQLEQVIDAQRAYWKFIGILAIVAMGFVVVAFLVGGLAAGMWMMRSAG